jgi:hypothetical protein
VLIEAFESSLALDPAARTAQTALQAVMGLSRADGAAIYLLRQGGLQLVASNLSAASSTRTQPDLEGTRQAPACFVQAPIAAGDRTIGLLYVEGSDLASPEARARIADCASVLGRMLGDAAPP